ncbi:MAG: acyltransferase family protein [bacterium]
MDQSAESNLSKLVEEPTLDLPDEQNSAQGEPLKPKRIGSIDAYRGMVMFLLMAEALHLGQMAKNFPESGFWRTLAYHQTHLEWISCSLKENIKPSLHDMIQPSFSFLVGVSLPFSLLSRRAKGQSKSTMWAHAAWRSFLLVGLGVFLRSVGRKQTNFTFEDTLSQIGLGYLFLFGLAFYSRKIQWAALGFILAAYWALFAFYPAPGPNFDYNAAGVPEGWPHLMTGFESHWNINSNPAWAFDRWFLNLFPRETPFAFNRGGYSTISFIPTLGTMILGLIAGGLMTRNLPSWKTGVQFALLGVVLLVVGIGMGELGLCPVVKKIWTPSWTLFSGGICFLFLSFYVMACDALNLTDLFWPLRIIGANCIFVYVVIHWWNAFIQKNIKTHLGENIFKIFGDGYEPVVAGAATMLIYWLILVWMDKNRVRIRI